MDDWITNSTENSKPPVLDNSYVAELVSGKHQLFLTNHAKPTYCNVCTDALYGVTSHGLSCEICKYKVHKRCSDKAINNCKWTTLASIGKNIIEDQDGNIYMPHQWIEGNLSVASKCSVCEKTCGSVLRLQDWRCLWCKITVHTACRPNISIKCPLGPAKLSIVPPTALHNIGNDEAWDAVRPTGCSPLLVFVNSKSGDNQGVKFLRRFKQLLNPAQVFDLTDGGPGPGLRLFRHFDPFRILVCSGDGSVGWVLSEIDRLGMHKQCQVGVLPLGTGNDLSRVLGWGGSCDDDTHLPHLLEKYEKAGTKMLDRWSIMTFERGISVPVNKEENQPDSMINTAVLHDYEDGVVSQITNILESDQEEVVISNTEILSETVKDFILRLSELSFKSGENLIVDKCKNLQIKLDSFIDTVNEEKIYLDIESDSNTLKSDVSSLSDKEKISLNKLEKDTNNRKKLCKNKSFSENQTVISRANSLKRSVRQLLEFAERLNDENSANKSPMLSPSRRKKSYIPDNLITSELKRSTETSPCSSPLPDITNISPMPDVRRDSQGGDLLTAIPAPVGFGDESRRNSLNQGSNYDEQHINQPLEPLPEVPGETISSLIANGSEKSSPSEDATIKDVMMSPDTDSLPSGDTYSEFPDTKEFTKCTESEIAHIDSDILSSTISHIISDLANIDSSENSESYNSDPQNSDSLPDDLSSLKQDLISTADGEKLNSTQEEFYPRRNERRCTLVGFGEGSDISVQIRSINNQQGSPNFPPSIVVDPPSPSKSKDEPNITFPKLDSKGSMEKLSVELPEGMHSHGTRRISCGSLFKTNEAITLPTPAMKFGGSNLSLRHERAKSVDKTAEAKKLPIINPLVRLPMWPNVSGGFISQALLANADALCAAVSPLMDPDETLMEGYFERCVMNNYFGIGIDAKISLDFHHKREEHPEKCRSRAKNYMWYGVLGSKQLLQKTYKNLDQRVQIECDGERIPLPSLQGIVVLNIPSFMGGTNFWGGTKEGDIFLAPSFDDRILEVVAVFGSVQMAASRLINLQHHRIAQCQNMQINILGDEGVPIQVDGEAWIQPPGIIRIIHKNRMQMLYRNRALESSLKTWEERQRNTMPIVTHGSSTTLTHSGRQSMQIDARQAILSEEEMVILLSIIEVITTLVKWVKLLIISHPSLERHLYQIASRTSVLLEKLHPDGKILQGITLRPLVTEVVTSARQLYEESCELLRDKAPSLRLRENLANKLSDSLAAMEQELRKCIFDERETGLVYLQNVVEEPDKKKRQRGLFWSKFRRGGATSSNLKEQVSNWSVQEVCNWLESLQLDEEDAANYAEQFVKHDIRGRELLGLARCDLKELGITKVGHLKRIQLSIKDLNN